MRCWTCDYSLVQLKDNRCPECGREFNPGDSRTYFVGKWPRAVKLFVFFMLFGVPLFAFWMAVLCVALWYLDPRIHWPVLIWLVINASGTVGGLWVLLLRRVYWPHG